ncbi:MAG: SdiA-regulated domain-containing protein [Pseudomonadota bacterium]
MPAFPRCLLRPRWLFAACVLLGSTALIHGLQLDARALFWLQEGSLSEEGREASIWLPGYTAVVQARSLAGLEGDETSGLSFNPVTGTLFTVTGKHPLLVELSLEGEVLRRIELIGFANPEGVEVMGDGRISIIDERRRQLTTFVLPDGAERIDASDLPRFDLGLDETGNKGFEGIAWDGRHQRLLLAHERNPLGLFSLPFPTADGAAGLMTALPAGSLFIRDLSSLAVDPRTGHTLLLSDESRLLLEVDEQGEPVSFISLIGGLNGLDQAIRQAEGVAMDGAGNIYVVGEPNLFYVFSKTPSVTAIPLLKVAPPAQ